MPNRSPLTAPYWDAAARGELAIQRCRSCGRWIHFPEPRCPKCGGGDLAFETVSGQGKVETFSVIHRAFNPTFADRTPYVIAWIGLPEQAGLRVFGNVTGYRPGRRCRDRHGRSNSPSRQRDGVAALPNFRAVANKTS